MLDPLHILKNQDLKRIRKERRAAFNEDRIQTRNFKKNQARIRENLVNNKSLRNKRMRKNNLSPKAEYKAENQKRVNVIRNRGEIFTVTSGTSQDAHSEIRRTRRGRTSMQYNHYHHYEIDADGNGYTTYDCHPSNPGICHKHKITNYQVATAASRCYPCVGIGGPGAGPHTHKTGAQNA